jgi:hypothetical protein
LGGWRESIEKDMPSNLSNPVILMFGKVIVFEATLQECVKELRSTLEDWILVGLKLGHPLPSA